MQDAPGPRRLYVRAYAPAVAVAALVAVACSALFLRWLMRPAAVDARFGCVPRLAADVAAPAGLAIDGDVAFVVVGGGHDWNAFTINAVD